MNYNFYYPPREDTSKDEEIAKMLQRLENLEISNQNQPNPIQPNPLGGSLIQSIPNNSAVFSSLVLPVEEDKCVICKQSFGVNYYSFPSCAPRSKHNYCEVCAKRLITLNENKIYGAEPSFSVTCKYCHSKTELRNIAALENYRKTVQPNAAKKEGLFKDGNCPYHDKMLIYFCNTCYEPICASCSSGFHKTHRIDDLDSAFHKVQQQLHNAKSSLDFKRSKVNQNVQTLLDSRESLCKHADTSRVKLNNEIDQLITSLQNKKLQLNQKITDLEETKKTEIDTALSNCAKSIDEIDEALEFVNVQTQNPGYLQNPNPLEFFQVIGSKGKDFVSNLTNKSVPFVPPTYHFADLSTHQVRKDINNLKLPF